jgi:hypothetical protein
VSISNTVGSAAGSDPKYDKRTIDMLSNMSTRERNKFVRENSTGGTKEVRREARSAAKAARKAGDKETAKTVKKLANTKKSKAGSEKRKARRMEERKAKRMEERKAKRMEERKARRRPGLGRSSSSKPSARRSPAARRKVNKSRTRR